MPISSVLRVFNLKKRSTPDVPSLPIALLGAGRMGEYHARALSRLRDVRVVGIVDSDGTRASALAKKLHCRSFPTLDPLLDQIQAAIIATPTPTHFLLAEQCLKAGIHCLVEKPLASTPEEA